MREPRSDFADCSPSTHEIASAMFDFPQPLGPMMAAMPSPWNFSSVRSQNDLNPRICSFLSLSKVTPSLDTVVRGLGWRWLECAANCGNLEVNFYPVNFQGSSLVAYSHN